MKLIFHSLLTFIFSFSALALSASSVPHQDGGEKTVRVIVDFGRKSKNCERFGVCSITVETTSSRQSGPSGENTATGTAWIENGKLKISFDRSSITEDTYNTHFVNGRFKLEEDYTLDSEIAIELGVRSYTIKAGTYTAPRSVQENGEFPMTF